MINGLSSGKFGAFFSLITDYCLLITDYCLLITDYWLLITVY